MFPALSGQIVTSMWKPTAFLRASCYPVPAHHACGERDLADMWRLASEGGVKFRRAMALAELKSSDYGEEDFDGPC